MKYWNATATQIVAMQNEIDRRMKAAGWDLDGMRTDSIKFRDEVVKEMGLEEFDRTEQWKDTLQAVRDKAGLPKIDTGLAL
jgi:hypothetical protein